ncbi:MAG: hypothetical protein IT427_10420 [Pirellulales bacterium]|nr:hypothetical protein [Pirellulales bacterium]
MAKSPPTVDPRAIVETPEKSPTPQRLVASMQELSRLDRAKTGAHDALRLWLRWNAIHETLAKSMFNKRHDQTELERLMDEAEDLRRQAIQLSMECLLEQG